MYDIFKGLFDHSLLTLTFTAKTGSKVPKIIAYAVLNTSLRAAVLYMAVRLIFTAFSHGSF